jgi:hypothetical protein
MKPVRPFTKDDIPQVADLHRRVFKVGGKAAQQPISARLAQDYAAYFEAIFFQNPWYDEAFPSLVSQDRKGKITGFLGVLPRRMRWQGRRLHVAISSQFIVAPDQRAMGAGVLLSKAFLSGPQDLSLTDEANAVSRKLWEGLGGVTSLLHSLHWTRLLRPSRYVVSFFSAALGGHKLTVPLRLMTKPFCNWADTMAARKLPRRFSQPQPEVEARELSVEGLLDCLTEFAEQRALWPEYESRSLGWVWETIARKTQWGALRMRAIYNTRDTLLGWYVYYLKPAGESNVLQLMAKKNSIEVVLEHLFYDAWRHGSLAITGRAEPQFMPALVDKYCLFNGGPWVLLHSHDSHLLQSIQQGDALLSKLEGEWCIRFK